MNPSTKSGPLKELLKVFLRLGILGFGGPAAHIALMHKEVVERRNWLSEQEFMDLVGATQLIPGPNSTELAIHIGHRRGGWKGLLVAGSAFILPAFCSVLLLAFLYVKWGGLPQFHPILIGIRPVIMAIIAEALWKFRKSAIFNLPTFLIASAGLVLAYLGVNEVLLILGLGLGYGLLTTRSTHSLFLLPLSVVQTPAISGPSIFWFFLKIGSVLFGSGYVLLALLQAELVQGRMWLTEKQLLDAITVGQITPGPVFTTATFIGYLLQSYQGAILATVGIFLPSFFFVALSAPYVTKLRSSNSMSHFLNGVNAASFALLVKVTFELGRSSFVNFPTILVALISLVMILKFKNLNTVWLLIAAGLLGYFSF